MLIIPAIDLKDGKVTRLTRGDFQFEKIYSSDPIGIAKRWQAAGARRLHLVDLNGAISGDFKNLDLIEEIIKYVRIPVELGGGVRSEGVIEDALSIGASYVIVGTRLVDKEFTTRIIKKYGDKLIMGIDAKGGKIAIEGWTDTTEISYLEFMQRLKDEGAKTFIFTDIDKDGMLQGPNFDSIKAILSEIKVDLIASGGISSLDDLQVLKRLEVKGLIGAIIGKALYEGRIDLQAAIEVVDMTTDF